MAKSNLDKFLEIEKMMEDAESYMESYLSKLKERYDYMNEYRRLYSNLSHKFGQIKQQLIKQNDELEADDDINIVLKSAIEKIDKEIEMAEEMRNNKSLQQLENAKYSLEEKLNMKNVGKAWRLLKVNDVEIEEVEVLMDLLEAMGGGDDTVAEQILGKIEYFQSEYLSSFVVFRKADEQNDDVYNALNDIIGGLEDAQLYKEASLLSEVLPNIGTERAKRPDPQPLLDLLNPIKSAGLEYFQSNNRNSESYDLNVKVAKEVAYVRRALLEDREYIGTRNAFERLISAFDTLSTYMYDRYHQLGGTPVNYHGHDDRKKK